MSVRTRETWSPPRRRGVAAAVVAGIVVVASGLPVAAQDPGPGDPDPSSPTTAQPPTTATTAPPATTTVPPGPGDSSTTSTTLPDEGPEVDLPGPGPGGLTAQDAATLDELRRGYEGTTAEELDFFERFLASQSLVQNLSLELYVLEGRIAEVSQTLDGARLDLDRADAEVAAARLRLSRAETDLDGAQSDLQDQAVQAYISGGTAPAGWSALLRSNHANSLSTSIAYSQAIHEQHRRAVAAVTTARQEAGDAEAEATAQLVRAVEARDLVTIRRDVLASEREQQQRARAAAELAALEQQSLLAETAERRAEYEARITAIAGVSDSISGLLAERQEGQEPPPITTAIFQPPVRGGAITSQFGPRVHPIYGVARMHNGIDIDGDTGTPIRAAGFGEVVIADERGGYGQCVVVDHGNGLATLYAHMSTMTVRPGDLVAPGDVLGAVGSTGLSTGPHLHFEVRVKGQPVNPLPYLAPDPDLPPG